MKKKSRTATDKMILAIGGVIAIAAAGFFWSMTRPTDTAVPIVGAGHGAGAAAPAPKEGTIIIPELSQIAQSGQIAFKESCAACHGATLAGTDSGPPLIHQLYVPGHHGDTAIARAAKNGVISHHWGFGNMPPVAGITDANLRWITTYIREMQVANGIK
ncbi:MAG: cytochrome C [Rhodobacteraceae bacterium]|nr:MAG: cytochrome C [Paracoccaceae bacterium]